MNGRTSACRECSENDHHQTNSEGQLLSFSRQQDLWPEPIPMDQFLQVNSSVLEQLAGPDIGAKLRIDDPIPVVRADP